MKLWIGGEIEADVADTFRVTRNAVERAVNRVIESKDYSLQLKKWSCIAIVRADTLMPERLRYSPKRQEMDFRLALDHGRFLSGTDSERRAMLFAMLRRSLSLLETKLPTRGGLDNLKEDLSTVELTPPSPDPECV
jgi:hypothetical protein